MGGCCGMRLLEILMGEMGIAGGDEETGRACLGT